MSKPLLYIHVRNAKHFLRWELPEFRRYFELVDHPSESSLLLSFGPDALESAAALPARKRFAVLFPGFSHNPVTDLRTRELHLRLIAGFDQVFINPGPLEIAYATAGNVTLYPFSIDVDFVGRHRTRTTLDSLLHVSHDNPQKDWQRSASIMAKTGLRFEVYPPRDAQVLQAHVDRIDRLNAIRRRIGLDAKSRLPVGYFDHRSTVKKYGEYDGFVHVARNVGHIEFIDGKYTASLIEAGVTGAIVFWHDTWGLGNGLETVFDLPVRTADAAARLLEIRSSLDIERHSRATREEMITTFNPRRSVAIRAERMIELDDAR